jgi:PAS domain S-box-containing protein
MTVHSFLHLMRRMGALMLCLHTIFSLIGQGADNEAETGVSPAILPEVTSLYELDIQGNERIRNGVLVEVSAYVSYHDPVLDVLFVQDDSAGIFVAAKDPALAHLPVGTSVTVSGVAEPGKFKPYLSKAEVVRMDEGVITLDALEIDLQILETGRYDGQMVQVAGRVRSVDVNGHSLALKLLNQGRPFTAFVRDFPENVDAQSLVDSVIEVSGACGFDFDGNELLSVRLYLDKFDQLKIVVPSGTHFAQAPSGRVQIESSEDMLRASGERTLLHGNYLGPADDGHFYFQTPKQGFLVERAHSIEILKRGDPIGVLGWVRLEADGAMMRIEQPLVKKLDSGSVSTLAEQSTDALTASNLNRWLSLKGKLIDVETGDGLLVFHLESNGKHIAAMFGGHTNKVELLVPPAEGSLLEVSGVLTGLPSEQGIGEFPSLKLYSLSDVEVLSPPSWWTVERITWALVGAALIGFAAVGWSVLLNRRVKQQTSALRQTLEQERMAEERYRKIFESALDMILLADHRAHILSINPAGVELLQDEASSFIGKSFLEWVYLEDRGKAEEAFGLGSKSGRELSMDGEVIELRLVAKGGDSVYVELSVRGVLLSGGTYGYQCIARNIDERKQSEAHLIKARNAFRDANRAKSSFLAMMSHELRTPMNGVMGMTQMLQHTKLDAHQLELAKSIQVSSEAMMKLIFDLLDISRIESDQLKLAEEPFDLVQVVEDALATLYPESMRKKLNLTLYCQPRIPNQLLGDATRLRQIILNLVGNGIKFTDKGGVAVHVTGEAQSKMIHQIRFEVIDTGIGLGGLRQQDLFEAFVQLDSSNTRKFGGAGLGLSICKRIVQAMGGVIGVEGQTKQGAIFWFEIPFKIAHAHSSVRLPRISSSVLGTKVDIVSNCGLVCDFFRMRCKDLGLSARYETPDEFLTTLEKVSTDSSKEPSIVVLDLESLSGEWLKRYQENVDKKARDHVRWVMLSSLEDTSNGLSQVIPQPQLLRLLKPLTETAFRTFCDFISDQQQLHAEQGVPGNPELAEGSTSSEKELACRGLKVLVAEDDLINQKLILLYLKKAGCLYEIVPDGKQALAMLEQKAFDVVLMDCSMPVMDGFEAARQIRKNPNYNRLKVIALTAHSLKGDRERCLKAGMDDYMAKPLNLDKLTEKLSDIKSASVANGH